MNKTSNGLYTGSVNGNVYVVVRNNKVWDWATYNGIGGECVNSGTELSSSKAEKKALQSFK
ncbi:hypothetical protein [Oceanispirochaeta sp.]|jgi:hypothetical protein|uniref:hypothetical protein n=1 Tax=Oceanispirochaeta sp. TaxID=2035350 RepID=UPI00261546B5|nr:hypothetical protein [Oceanispirochaeta sp.]MDA3956880.1 hypothetical protein [Oceanispirochaeta sp.]